MTDPFIFHPNLRDLIKDPATSGMRGFEPHSIARANPHLDLKDFLTPIEVREKNRHEFLAVHGNNDLWIFAYGSLCWDPGFYFQEVRRAQVQGFKRRFILHDKSGGRGNAEAPGLMAALDHTNDPSSLCDGLLFRIDKTQLEQETPQIWAQELAGDAYIVATVGASLSDGTVQALTFVANHDAQAIDESISRQDQISCIATGEGFLGTSLEYAQNFVTNLAEIGIEDPDLNDLLADAKAHHQLLAKAGN